MRNEIEAGGMKVKKLKAIILSAGLISVLAACGAKEEVPVKEAPEVFPIEVELTVTEEVDIDEVVEMSTLVTMGDRKLDDASEVVYEVWEEGKKSDSVMIDSVNEGEGIYTAETSFEHDGLFNIQVHVTAEAQHSMPVKKVTVGEGGEYEEEAGHDYHTEGFAMHFMKPGDVESGEEAALVVHIELNEEPLKDLSVVRYEIWHEGNPDKHDWVDADEKEDGEYSTSYSFEEKGKYTIVVHVEDDADLHEHEEHEVEVK